MRRLLVVLACALLLTGCAQRGAAPAPTPSASGPTVADLAGGFWSVSGAEGEAASTRVRFGYRTADVFRARGRVDLAMESRGDRLLAMVSGWSMSLGDEHEVPWLVTAERVRSDGDGVVLLDRSDVVVARLRRADPPATSKQYETDSTSPGDPSTPPSIPLGTGSGDVAASAITGTWRLAGHDDAALHMESDGDWKATTSCDSGSGANGGGGRWAVLPGGALLVVSFASTAMGCSEPEHPSPDAAAIGSFWNAASVALDGDRLTVYDRSGEPLGTLVR